MNTLKIITISSAILAGSYFVANSPLIPYVTYAGKYKTTPIPPQQDKPVPSITSFNENISATNKYKELVDKELGTLNFKRQSFAPGIVFRIQVLTLKEPVSAYSDLFDGCMDVREYITEGNYRYTVGKFKAPEQSNYMFTELYGKGFEDAFMVAFRDDKPIPLKTAMQLIRKR